MVSKWSVEWHNPETKADQEKIWPHNSPEKNLQILHERLNEVKTWFDYKVTDEKKYKLLYNWHELNVEMKWWNELIEVAKLVKRILDDYKQHWFDKNFPKFYSTRTEDWFEVDLRVNNNLIREDYLSSQWIWISKIMWSNLDISNSHFANNVRWKIEYNTDKMADFLNEIVKDFIK